MKRDEIRLECLKLCQRHDRSQAEVVLAAKIFEEYISKDLPEDSFREQKLPEKKPTVLKKVDNSNPLD